VEAGHGSPAGSSGVSRARERAGMHELRRGSECGHERGSKRAGAWAERLGQGSRRRARVRTRWSTAGEGRAELTGEAHNADRENECAGVTVQRLTARAREAERGEGCAEGRNWRRQPSPTGQRARGREGSEGQTIVDRQDPPVRGGRRAGAWPGWASLARMAFPFS
jgi:hypothetical protein